MFVFLFLWNLQGIPMLMLHSSVFFRTNEFAPVTDPSAKMTPGITVVCVPSCTKSFKTTGFDITLVNC